MDAPSLSVMALFRRGQLEPKAFRLRGRTVLLDRVTLAYQTKDAGRILWYFNVQAEGAVHTLQYAPDQFKWRLVASTPTE